MKIISIQKVDMHFIFIFFPLSWTFLFVKTPNKDDNEKAQYFNVLAFKTLADTQKNNKVH